MKTDFLGFPKEFEVGKEIKEQFLKSSTVTPGRMRIIEQRVTDIELMYDLHLKDGSEMMVFLTGIDKTVDDYTEKNVAAAIASSIPYCSMVIVHNGLAARIFAFDMVRQEKNYGRMRINSMHISFKINLGSINDRDERLFKRFRQCIHDSDTAKDLAEKWCNVINDEWNSYKEERKEAWRERMENFDDEALELRLDQWLHSNDKFLDDAEKKRENYRLDYYGEEFPSDESESDQYDIYDKYDNYGYDDNYY